MKKYVSLILATLFAVQLAACSPADTNKTAFVSSKPTASQTLSSEGDSPKNETASDDPVSSLEGVTDFDSFVDKFEENNDIEVTERDDGSITVEIKSPADDEDDEDSKPAIPTIDKVVKPEPTPTPEPEPEPEPTPEPEPEPEPTPTPAPTSKPEAPVVDTKAQYRGYTYTTNQKHTALGSLDRYLYSILDSTRQSWYRAIDKAISNLEPSVEFNVNICENRNYMVYFMYMFDHPEYFFLGNTSTMFNHGDGTSSISFCYSDGEEYCDYGHVPSTLTPELKASILKKKAIFDAEVARIISTIPANAPDVVKEKLIYDRILLDSYYNLNARWNGVCEPNWNAYGIIVNKYGVCESYSEAFQTLCTAVGIRCTGIVGSAGGGHKWNAVQLDGEWYVCDITFDDPVGGDPDYAYHCYFNRTTAQMEADGHSTEGSDYPGPICTATKYAYSNCFD